MGCAVSASRAGSHAGWKDPKPKLRLGIDCQPFYLPRCENRRCRAVLADAEGNPRWDLLEGRFVCLGGCTEARASATRKAALT